MKYMTRSRVGKEWASWPPEERAWNWSDLDENSIIFEIGGHEGRFTSEMVQRYNPYIWYFEPSPRAFGVAKGKFDSNPKVKMHEFGLGNKNGIFTFGDESRHGGSFLSVDPPLVQARMVDIVEFFTEHNINYVDFMQVNIEGGEYHLLPHMIGNNLLERIQRLMLHWHPEFVNEKVAFCHRAIHAKICETHYVTRSWTFEVWEKRDE
jgi:FkbM family methyltransferase